MTEPRNSKTKQPVSEPKKKLSFSSLWRLLSYTRPYRRVLILAVTLSVVLAALSPVRPYLIQLSVDKYIGGKMWEGLLIISAIHFGILIIESALRLWFMYRTAWLGQTTVADLRTKVFDKVIHQNIGYFDRTPIGTLTTRTVNDLESVAEVFSEGIISIIADVLTIIAIMAVMLWTDWRLTLVCLAPFPILIAATYWFKESVNKSFNRVRNAVAALNAFVQERIVGMYIVQAFAAEKSQEEEFRKINREHRSANIKSIFAYSVFFPVVEIILALSTGLLVWYGAVEILNYSVTPGIIIAFVMYLNLLFRPLRMLADKFNVLQMGMIAAERVFGVLDSEENLQNDGTFAPKSIAGEVAFEDVRFSYKPEVPVLRGISFNLPAGQTMAVVGPTGAGKTSLISILTRLYEIEGGRILIDGRDLRDYDIKALRSRVGIVLQDVFLFSGSIYDNITLRNHSIPREKVAQVCKMLGIHDSIVRLPGGYDFDVLERGATLSQGQRQLLSFARALVYDPAILILDEATSSVDSESEQLIQHAIDVLVKGRTSIVIAHRLSTIRSADVITVLEAGRVVESGNHESLIAARGAYFKLYTAVEKEREEAEVL